MKERITKPQLVVKLAELKGEHESLLSFVKDVEEQRNNYAASLKSRERTDRKNSRIGTVLFILLIVSLIANGILLLS